VCPVQVGEAIKCVRVDELFLTKGKKKKMGDDQNLFGGGKFFVGEYRGVFEGGGANTDAQSERVKGGGGQHGGDCFEKDQEKTGERALEA